MDLNVTVVSVQAEAGAVLTKSPDCFSGLTLGEELWYTDPEVGLNLQDGFLNSAIECVINHLPIQ